MTAPDLEALRAKLAELTQWRRDNALEKAGTPEFTRATETHRWLTDLIERDGGTPAEREAFIRFINKA